MRKTFCPRKLSVGSSRGVGFGGFVGFTGRRRRLGYGIEDGFYPLGDFIAAGPVVFFNGPEAAVSGIVIGHKLEVVLVICFGQQRQGFDFSVEYLVGFALAELPGVGGGFEQADAV